MDTRQAKAEDLANLISMVSRSFLYNKEEKVDRDFPLLYSTKNIQHLYVAEENGSLIAHAGFYPARMRLEGGEITVAGIGGVATVPEAQGKGHASTLINLCIEAAKAEKIALAFLWTDKHDFYRKQGFELVGRQWCIELTPEALGNLEKHVEDNQLTFTFSEKKNVPFLQQSFALFAKQAVGIIRSREEHAALLSSAGCQVFSAWNGEQLLAYMVLNKGHDLGGFIHEWAGEESALLWLLEAVAGGAYGAKYLLSPQFMPHEEKWIYILDQLGFPMVAQYMGMAKILDLVPIIDVMETYIERLGIAPSELKITPVGDKYEINWRDNWKHTLTNAEFLRFLFGPELPDHEELRGIFPMRVWYWGMDSV